jgi:hypothetical protein
LCCNSSKHFLICSIYLHFEGGNRDGFKVEIYHNGFFSRFHEEFLYIDGSTNHFDNFLVDTWVNSLHTRLADRPRMCVDEKMQVYCCKPRNDFSDGMVCIENGVDIFSVIEVSK